MHRPTTTTTTARIGLALTLAVALLLTAVPASGGSGQQGSGPRPRSGECTDWANHKRPDIMRSNPRAYWIAYAWDDLARRAGYKVNQQPAAGTIAVWEANRGGAFWAGHVAYVKSVARNGAVTISEMNWNGIRTPTKRVLNSSQVRAAEFIHHR